MKWNPISLELSFNRALYSHATLIVITLNSSWGNKIGKSTKKEKRCYLSGFSYFDRSHVSACSSKRQESLTNKRDSPFLTSSSSSDNVRNWRCLHQMENGHADKNLGDNARPYGVHDCDVWPTKYSPSQSSQPFSYPLKLHCDHWPSS